LSSEWAIAIGAQWLLIVLLVRFLLSYANGLDALRSDLALFTRGAFADLFTPEFVASIVLALLIWFFTGRFLDVLDQVGLDQRLASQEGEGPIQGEAVPAHQRLVAWVFSIGIGLVIMTALARVDYRTLVTSQGKLNVDFTQFSGAEAGALFYFVFGLALLSLSRLMSLQTHWNRLRIPVSSRNLYRQWAMYSVFFLLILAVMVSLLPAGDNLGFFSVLGVLFNFLISVLFFLGQLILSLLMLLVSLPFLLFGGAPPELQPSAPPPMPVLPTAPPSPSAPNPVWPVVRSILLWAGLAGIAIFAFLQFVRQHGGLRATLRQARLTNWLILAWQWLYKNAGKTGASVSRALADGWHNIVLRLEGKRILPRPNLINVRSLDPRRQIYFFYLAMIRRAGEQGINREPSQTPAEYAAALEKALPAADDDIDSLTTAFIEARYSRREVPPERARYVRATWDRLRRALQDKAKRERSANE
jgi:hypothetical protein